MSIDEDFWMLHLVDFYGFYGVNNSKVNLQDLRSLLVSKIYYWNVYIYYTSYWSITNGQFLGLVLLYVVYRTL